MTAPSAQPLPFLKGHGTENDFVLVPDPDGTLGPVPPEVVRQLCDRHAGLGADGVIRVVRTDATDDPAAVAARGEAAWFMDYLNSDGSTSEMCGNGVRVLGRYLADREGVDVTHGLPISTRDGVKRLTFDGDQITVDMGRPRTSGSSKVQVADRVWDAVGVDLGNPHAVAFVDDLSDAGLLLDEPDYDRAVYPHGVNIEFVVRRGAQHVAMRVHERGSGETRSCGTGACAVMVAAALADGAGPGSAYRVDVPGGTLHLRWTEDDRVLMTGPAVLVAEGNWLADR
jgi:diaminopimelate epimerase